MTNSKSSSNSTNSFSWRDIIVRAAIPGLLLAITGFISEWVITSSSSKAENARLVTDLQIQREQAESDLRKDIFTKAVEALIGNTGKQSKIEDHSKRLLKLELLALNFGDSIFLSPLFKELEKDLRRHMNSEPADSPSVLRLIDRLRSLAKRVSVEQLSFLSQRGTSVQIQIPLTSDGKSFCNGNKEYVWPNDEYRGIKLCRKEGEILLGEDGKEAPICQEDPDSEYVWSEDFKDLLKNTASISLNKSGAEERYITAGFSDPKPDRASIRVSLGICEFNNISGCDASDKNTVERTFTLDYFNFPTIDNTRL
ncbi:MAG: hypothetical protein R3351_02540, partial [Nitrospirales bacterium]|nr:hypothetical protein [Nitrospirales bacterium]